MEASCGELVDGDEPYDGFPKQQDRMLIRADILEFDFGIFGRWKYKGLGFMKMIVCTR